jgi:hypothetical protein
MSKASDEKAKLTANLLNAMAINALSVGIIAPIVAWISNLGGFQALISPLAFVFSTLFWGYLALRLHLYALSLLDRLDADVPRNAS